MHALPMHAFIPGHSGFHSPTANAVFCPCTDLFPVVLLCSFPLKATLTHAAHRDATDLTRGSIKANEAWEDMRGRRGTKPNDVEDDITSTQLRRLWCLSCSRTSFNISIMSKDEEKKNPIIITEVSDLTAPDGKSRFNVFIVSTIGKMFLSKREFFLLQPQYRIGMKNCTFKK